VNLLLTTVSLDPELGGGTAERTRKLALHLRALGVDCRVLTMQGGALADELIAASIPVHVTGLVRIRFQVPFLNPFRLCQLVRDADVIHVLGYWNLLSVATCAIATSMGRPYLLSAAGEFAAPPTPSKAAFHALLGKRMIRNAASIVAITELERAQIESELKGSSMRLVVIPNGVDAVDEQIERDERFPQGPFVLFLGRLAHVKGPDLLLDAFAGIAPAFPNVKLVFAGPDFGMRQGLEQQIQKLGLGDRVVFTGFLDERARRAGYRRATLLAVPSRSEAMSLVALEAGAAGTPVLLTDQCGFDDVTVVDGGRVVPATVEGLQAGLREMLSAQDVLPAMGNRLHALVIEKFAWPAIASRFRSHLCATVRGAKRLNQAGGLT
jgi:glycosyltransferase involved in cell wall biosynthesis